MQSEKKAQNRLAAAPEINFEAAEKLNCVQIKNKLDELFGGRFSLEKMDIRTKTFLFRHLEVCGNCCRAFDVRVHFRPVGRATIY